MQRSTPSPIQRSTPSPMQISTPSPIQRSTPSPMQKPTPSPVQTLNTPSSCFTGTNKLIKKTKIDPVETAFHQMNTKIKYFQLKELGAAKLKSNKNIFLV